MTTDDVPAGPVTAPVVVTLTAADTGGSGVDVTTYEVISAGGVTGSDEDV